MGTEDYNSVIGFLEVAVKKINPLYPIYGCRECGNRLICLTTSFVCIELEKMKKKFSVYGEGKTPLDDRE